MSSNQSGGMEFENEARRIARELWPSAQYSGADIVDGRERDGIFETEECLHLVEATISRSADKAAEDAKKLSKLAKTYQSKTPTKAVKCWFITRDEPTAEQRAAVQKYRDLVNILSFSQFQSRLIDVRTYIQARNNYPFGSVRDPATGAFNVTIEYIPLGLAECGSQKLWEISEVVDSVSGIGRFVLLGDYGAGKSMSLKHIYQKLCSQYLNTKTEKFPVYINLRDHFGQDNPAEVLERHARGIGSPHPYHLVRAWRAGYVTLLIDGFDEVATAGIQGLWKKLHDSRFRAMQAVRALVRQHPKNAGLVLAGRAHFFDSEKERRNALGTSDNFIELSLNEFTDAQIQEYLKRNNLRGTVPLWLPSRPLLVGYLVSKGLIKDILENKASGSDALDPAKGWNFLLDSIASREAEIEPGIDSHTVRRILERLATKARASQTGLGPLAHMQILDAFEEICGFMPDERGMILLQRLPGLGIDRSEEGTRIFIDEDIADACRVGDVFEFIKNPFDSIHPKTMEAECPLGDLGIEVATLRLNEVSCNTGKINAALGRAKKIGRPPVFISDMVRIAIQNDWPIEEQVNVHGVYLPALELRQGSANFSNVHFHDCYFNKLGIDHDVAADSLPRFSACFFGEVDGRISENDLPGGVFDEECIFDTFASTTITTDAIVDLSLPTGIKVLLTVLKKLYQQRGSGRKENALHRGLDHHGRRLVPEILRILEAEKLAIPYKRGTLLVWLPIRGAMARVGRIIASPTRSSDPVVSRVSNLD